MSKHECKTTHVNGAAIKDKENFVKKKKIFKCKQKNENKEKHSIHKTIPITL